MDTIRNYKLRKFLKLPEKKAVEYMYVLALCKPQETLREVFYLTVGQVQEIREKMSQGLLNDLIDVVGIVQDKTEEAVLDIKILDFFGYVKSVKEQIETIERAEQTALSSTVPNHKWELVNGSKRLEKFGIYNLLETISKGDIFKWEAAKQLSYADVFVKLHRDTVMDEINYEMSQIKTLKQ